MDALRHAALLREAALKIADLGFAVLPCGARGKQPLITHGVHDATREPATIALWCRRWSDANLAIALAPGHIVADIDNRSALVEALEARGASMASVFPPTAEVATPRGAHLHYTVASGVGLQNAVAALPGLDIKTAGGYVLIPPSVGADGTPYSWIRPLEQMVPASDQFLALARASGGPRQRSPAAWDTFVFRRYGLGERNGKMTSLTGYLLAKRIDPLVVLQLVRSFNVTNCVPPLNDAEVVRIWNSISRRHQGRHRR